MARTTTKYDGYGITELRAWARELKIAGRSKMSGDQLVAACKARAAELRIARENAVLDGETLAVGTLLAEACGCIIRSTSQVRYQVDSGPKPYPLYVRGEYVKQCTTRGYFHNATPLKVMNERAAGQYGTDPYRFFLHSLRRLTDAEWTALADELIPPSPLNPEPVYCGSDSAHDAHGNCGGSTVDVPPIPEHSDGRFEIGQRIATMQATLGAMLAKNRRTAPAPLERDNNVAGRMREAAHRDRLYLDDARALLLDAAREIERLQNLAADQDEFCRANLPELYS
jgi:hypothetical protein